MTRQNVVRMTRLATLTLAIAFNGTSIAAPTSIEIENPWCATTPKGVTIGACYVTIRNSGRADRIVGAQAERADHVELHQMSVADGVGRMRPLAKGLDIPADSTVDFREGGYHLMVIDLKSQLTTGETLRGSLQFENNGTIVV
ncbi:copper chaperone PCu(A)C, partial [Methylosinus sp. H3A]|uniref:copper chaperone PCu(A)C n=1 Tax=Methylosinus sp. H3A TaxID=2785786 RepID=UPI0018C3293B